MYTKTQERVEIIECDFFCLKGVYWESYARRLTNLEPNEIFNDFAISREAFGEIDSAFFYFKGMSQSHEDFRSWSRMKVLLAISWSSNEITNLIFRSFKYVDKN